MAANGARYVVAVRDELDLSPCVKLFRRTPLKPFCETGIFPVSIFATHPLTYVAVRPRLSCSHCKLEHFLSMYGVKWMYICGQPESVLVQSRVPTCLETYATRSARHAWHRAFLSHQPRQT